MARYPRNCLAQEPIIKLVALGDHLSFAEKKHKRDFFIKVIDALRADMDAGSLDLDFNMFRLECDKIWIKQQDIMKSSFDSALDIPFGIDTKPIVKIYFKNNTSKYDAKRTDVIKYYISRVQKFLDIHCTEYTLFDINFLSSFATLGNFNTELLNFIDTQIFSWGHP